MSPYIRSLRGYCKEVKYPQMREDIDIMERLSKLTVKMGRKTLASQDQRGEFSVRNRGDRDAKAVFTTKRKYGDSLRK